MYNPRTILLLQKAVREGSYETFKEYSALVDEPAKPHTLRGLLDFQFDESGGISIDEVEPVASIVKRFKTGAMSYGSISQEAHECLAIAMNRIGGKSNSGEGGEDAARLRDERPAGSALPAPTSPAPRRSRSRWLRVPSPARAAICPGKRSIPGLPGPGAPPPA